MRLAIVTLRFGDLPYFQYSSAINKAYCQRHAYEFLVFTPHLAPEDRSIHWMKIKAVLEALPHYDLVLWMDADAWVHDHARRLEDQLNLVRHAQNGTEIVIGTDRLNQEIGWSDGRANTGVFLVRNTALARQILEEWWDVPSYDPETARTWPVDQAAFNRHILPKWSSTGRVVLVDYRHLNGMDGEFIRHPMGQALSYRTHLLKVAHDQLLSHSL
jgi:hypothetical protein